MVDRSSTQPLLPEEVYERALAVGRRAAGVSGPNPPVGCLIVRDGDVLAEGATGPVGAAHAEVEALRHAGGAAAGATAVVTLEPCAHHGRTPPCTDALRDAGVAAVHLLVRDPDPTAAGGVARLAAAGIDVVDVGALRPDLHARAADDLRGFLTRVRDGRPHLTLKLAQTVDGVTVPPAGAYLTGTAARSHVHRLRARSDAVLVGGATLRADDPRLDVRHGAGTDGSGTSPRPVIVSASGDVPTSARAVRAGTLVVVGPDPHPERDAALAARGATVVRVPAADDGSGLDATAVVRCLLEHRVLTVLAEPGPRLARALLTADLVDAVEVHVAGGAAGGQVRPALPELADVVRVGADVDVVRADADLILRRARGGAVAASGLQEVA